MPRNRKQILISIFLWFLNANFITSIPPRFVDTLPTFTVPESNELSNVVVDHESGDVFVSGRNVLYHFSADLGMKQRVGTGPLIDAYDCSIPPYSCGVERRPINNYNHLLKLVNFSGSPPKLLLCGSAYKKLCQIRATNNLDEVHWVHPHNSTLGYNLGGQKNRALFERGHEGRWTLFTAHSVNTRNGNEVSVPVLSSKVLVKLKDQENGDYYFRNPLDGIMVSSSVFVYGIYRREVIDDGFVHDGYVYFLIKHIWGSNTTTRLMRICTEDPTFQSYAELLLQCILYDSVKPTYAIAAHYGDSPSLTDKSLYVSYKSLVEPYEGTALCVYPMSSIVKAFNETTGDCNREMFHDMCDREEESLTDSFCGSVSRPRLLKQPLIANSSVFLPNIWIPTITTVSQGSTTVVIGGADDGSIIKVNLNTKEFISNTSMLEKNTMIKRSSWDIFKKPFVFDRDGKNIYLLFQNKIIKYPVASCGVHETCSLCMARGKNDPLQCGWCEDRCTTVEECPHSSLFNQENCKRVRLYGIHPDKGPTSGGTNITLYGENLVYALDKASIFSVNKRICTLTVFDQTTASCTSGNLTFFREDLPESIALRSENVTYFIHQSTHVDINIKGLSDSFEYTPDPEIHQIEPRFTTVSGLMNVTATGLHLDSVKYPKLVVKISLQQNMKDLEILENCWSDPESKGAYMTCRTPHLPKIPRLAVPTSSSPLLTHVAFLMDGVQKLRDFNVHHEEMSRLWYYPDPVFEEVRRTGHKTLVIKGNYLQLFSLEDFKITLGNDFPCKIVDFSVEYLTCEIPSTVLWNSNFYETKISVEVVIGYSKYQIGYVTIEKPDDENFDPPPNPVWWILLVLIPICLISIIFICLKYWRKTEDKNNHKKKSSSSINKNNHGDLPITFEDVKSSTVFVQNFPSAAQGESVDNQCNKMPFVNDAILSLLENMNLVIPTSCLVIGEKIGAGQFGCVFAGVMQRPKETEKKKVAIKTLREHSWSNSQTVEVFLKEALIMKDFDHPNVLSLLGVCFKDCGPSIVLPFMDNGDLCSYVKDETNFLLVTNLLKFSIDIAAGMLYLEERKFLHRDLAARNCILDSSLCVKVADFGLSRDVYVDDYYCCENSKAKLPYRWMAPESIEKHLYSTKTDVWSYGVLLWELMTRGSVPYANIANWEVLEYVKLGHRLDQPDTCPKSLYKIMLACWNRESKERPTFSLLHECISYIRQRIIDRKQKNLPPKSIPSQNSVYCSNKIPNYSNELLNHGNGLPNNGNGLTNHGNRHSNHWSELSNNGNGLPNHCNELPNNSNGLPNHCNELPNNSNELPNNSNGLPNHCNELPNNGNRLLNHCNELSNNEKGLPNQLPNNGNGVPKYGNRLPNQLLNDCNGLTNHGNELTNDCNEPYFRMDGYVLNKSILEKSCNLENEYLDMKTNANECLDMNTNANEYLDMNKNANEYLGMNINANECLDMNTNANEYLDMNKNASV